MIGKTNSGSGGGGSKLKVIAYPTDTGIPDKPKNNTIAVITDKPILDFYICPKAPDHSENRVWIKVGEYGVAYIYGKNNANSFVLSGAFQSVEGEWVELVAKLGSKVDGNLIWSDIFPMVIFDGEGRKLGAGATSMVNAGGSGGGAGSWSASVNEIDGVKVLDFGSKASNSSVKLSGYAGYAYGPIDLTNASKILATVTSTNVNGCQQGRIRVFGTNVYPTNSGNTDLAHSSVITAGTASSPNTVTAVCDLPDAAKIENAYVFIGLDFKLSGSSYQSVRQMRVSKLWLM